VSEMLNVEASVYNGQFEFVVLLNSVSRTRNVSATICAHEGFESQVIGETSSLHSLSCGRVGKTPEVRNVIIGGIMLVAALIVVLAQSLRRKSLTFGPTPKPDPRDLQLCVLMVCKKTLAARQLVKYPVAVEKLTHPKTPKKLAIGSPTIDDLCFGGHFLSSKFLRFS
jgi:hypothetical protein